MEEEGQEVCFDALPDSVACAILSKLRDAQTVAQCAAVCRRWRALCAAVDALSFESFQLFEKRVGRASKASCLEAIVSRMLLRSDGVRELGICYHPVEWPWIRGDHFSEDKVCAWLGHVRASLEKLVLVDPNRERPQPLKLLQLSRCPRLRWLNLCYGIIPDLPGDMKRMESLRTCVLDLIAITDSALEALLLLCPCLEDLRLNSCKGLRAPSLVSPRLASLELVHEMDMCEATVACLSLDTPKLTRLSLSYVEELIADGEALLELGLLCHVRPRIRDLSYLTALQMKGEVWLLESIVELVRLGANVTQLHVDAVIDNKSPIQLDALFRHLPLLTKLYIGADMFECVQAGAAGVTGSATLRLPRLEEIVAVVCSGSNGCIAVLATLLRCSSSLRSLRINAHQLSKGVGNITFFTDVLGLQREFSQVEIVLDCPYTLL
ncbi:hypothetical protein SELMODRAFT_450513 [Selaginella moellendorffii]|uniref:Uncharacterized protein n=1 Tax=Selaginella moellendorffii TaxID=88036 RepID=D8R4B7_SELML|nr:F-box protein At1g10780 [Selaginella moellendorffii]EFJ33082.1 hypothetical protein SELMODRAFT_450513 [Selaginella moellendorffii]|eukprot:XP_002965662.1 F-box protein At1g10780 [Selaginella moellendorffii]